MDPVTAYQTPTGAFNRYWYANNNPYKFTDPDGRLVTFSLEQSHCSGSTNIITLVPDMIQIGVFYTIRALQNSVASSQTNEQRSESAEGGNTNPYDGPVEEPVVVVDSDGNAIPVAGGEQISSSPNGRYQQVKDGSGNPTGTRLDKGGHQGHADPKAQAPHGHQPGVTDESGNPHLPLNEPSPPPPEPKL